MGTLIGLGLLLYVAGAAIGLWITYLVLYYAIRNGVRDGISNARIRVTPPPPPPSRSGMPDMRAD